MRLAAVPRGRRSSGRRGGGRLGWAGDLPGRSVLGGLLDVRLITAAGEGLDTGRGAVDLQHAVRHARCERVRPPLGGLLDWAGGLAGGLLACWRAAWAGGLGAVNGHTLRSCCPARQQCGAVAVAGRRRGPVAGGAVRICNAGVCHDDGGLLRLAARARSLSLGAGRTKLWLEGAHVVPPCLIITGRACKRGYTLSHSY